MGVRLAPIGLGFAVAILLAGRCAAQAVMTQDALETPTGVLTVEPPEPLHVHHTSLSRRVRLPNICRAGDPRSSVTGCKNLIASSRARLDRLRIDYERGGGKAEYEDRRQDVEQQMTMYNLALERIERPY